MFGGKVENMLTTLQMFLQVCVKRGENLALKSEETKYWQNIMLVDAHLQSLICRGSSSWKYFLNLYYRLDLRLDTPRDANTCKNTHLK